MNLCALLRCSGRRRLKQRLTHEEYAEWLRLWTWAPWHGDRDDQRAAYLASAVVAPHSRNGRMPRVADFLYGFGFGRAPKQRSEADLKKIIHHAPGRWIHRPPPIKQEEDADG